MTPPLLDTSIPTLTEVITPPAAEADHDAAAVTPLAASQPAEPALPAPAPAAAEAAPDWEALERDISLRVLGQLQGRIDFVLEHRVRDSLADVLQTAVESLTAEIRHGLQHTLQEVVTRAVAQEITHLRSARK